ncbi:MAG: carbohydrate kinase family protein [Lachnospiraceae bacterium]|nr:carbohydrate kinase family protein [Lachnospiraceae bacterium]
MSILSVGMAFCDIPLRPCPANIMELDNYMIDTVEAHTGGDALTVAVVLAKMGENVSLLVKVGDDGNGRFVLNELVKNRVNCDRMMVEKDYSTATSYQLIEEDGQRHFLVDCRINSLLKNADVPEDAIAGADLVFFGSALALAGMDDAEIAALFRRTHEHGRLTAMDASVAVKDNAECKMDLLRETLQYTDIFIPSYEEASYLAQKTDIQDIMEAFSSFPLKVFGIKLGGDGCILTEDFKNYVRLKPYPGVQVVDTTGAGDCFMGGFLCAYLKGWTLEECGKFATAVAAFGISAVGPSTAVPDFDTVVQFMKEH